jgi:pyridinium-3,5-biscarboxylic acid mononucleotide synthase
MKTESLRRLLTQVATNKMLVPAALDKLKDWPFEDLGFAKLDHHRDLRQGFPEIIYGEGKTPEQILTLAVKLYRRSGRVLISRTQAKLVPRLRRKKIPARFVPEARCIITSEPPRRELGLVVVVTAGTADIPAAEEAALTARLLGARVRRIFDVGVAGLHRLLSQQAALRQARVVIVAAGMDGALAAVVGGLVACPVIGLPTSTGYGACFAGVTPLLAMLTACAPNVTVVNIDDGIGAGFTAALINRTGD